MADGVITRERMFEPLLVALPGFREPWNEFLREWSDEAERPCYLALSSLARHLVDLLGRGADVELRAAFGVVEQWHVDGDAYVREAATVGLLENLQNGNLHASTEPEQFRRFLGPVSERWWNDVHRFWTEGRLLTDDGDDWYGRRVAVDYRQFYLWDPTVTPRAPEEYRDEDIVRRVKLAPHVVVVQPERNGDVAVVLRVGAADPGFDPAACDHVVECSVDVPGGRLQIHECLGSAVLDVAVEPGVYAVRVLFTGLASITEDGLDGDDRYTLQLWPAERRPLAVVKQWPHAGSDR